MLMNTTTRSQGFSDTPRWYVLRWGKKFTLACITAEGAYKLQERGWQLGERVCDTRQEADNHRTELMDRARRFQERQKLFVWEFASGLNRSITESNPTDEGECSRSKRISRQFDVAMSASVFNGFQLA